MLALAGYPLGLEFVFLDPAADACAAPLGDHLRAEYTDPQALMEFCRRIDIATYEFENVPDETARFVSGLKPLHPSPRALAVGQDRMTEKQLFDELGIPVPNYEPVGSRDDLDRVIRNLGYPAMLKTRQLGYDGKGQAVLRTAEDLGPAWEKLGRQPLLLESFVAFEREISCIGVRGANQQLSFYPVTENVHRNGILRTSIPRLNDPMQALAESHAGKLMEHLDYVGVLAFEFFVAGGKLYGNEIAPRVHNSGHWTIDGAHCSQFENHLRAIAGWPLGSTALRGPCAMVNFIGELPDLGKLVQFSGLHLHLYGKSPKPGRKIGHATLTAATDADLAVALAQLGKLIPG